MDTGYFAGRRLRGALLAGALSLLGPPLAAQNAPTLSLAPHHSGFRDVSQGGASLGYTTPAYVSLDEPRSVTVFYTTGQVAPSGFVQVDVTDNSATPPAYYVLKMQRVDTGEWVVFDQGVQDLVFTAGAGTQRLAGQFGANHLASRAYGYTLTVQSHWADGTVREASQFVRVPIVNERESPFGMGWSVAGVQRLHDQSDGVYVTQGDGTAVWFAGSTGAGYTAPEGDFSQMRFTGSGWVRRYPEGTEVHFDGGGRMTRVRDRFGSATSYAYDAAGRLSTITDPAGKALTFGYDASGKLSSVTDPAGRSTGFVVDAAGDLRDVNGADGARKLTVEYNAEHRVANYLDAQWARTDVGYDIHGQMRDQLLTWVGTTDSPDAVRPTFLFRSLELAVLPGRDASGGWTGTSRSSPAPRVLPADVRVEVTEPRGSTTRMAVDRFGSPTRVEEPLGRVTTLTRDAHGRVTYSRAPSGHEMAYTYSGLDLTRVQDHTTGAVVNLEYEPTYHEVRHVYGDVTEAWSYYNAQGLPDSTRVGTASSPVTKYTYTSHGRVKSVTDPEDHGSFITYGDEVTGGNAWGNTETVEAGSASTTTRRTTSYAYDGYGRLRKVTGPASDSTVTRYDVLNRVRQVINPQGGATTHFYGLLHLDSIADPKGQVYRFRYNDLGWVYGEVDPRGQTTWHGYDRGGFRSYTTNRRGQTINFFYDELGRLARRDADGGSTRWSYGNYAESDRWVEASNGESTDRISFDAAGRPVEERSTRGTTAYTLQSGYNVRSLRTALRMTSPWTRSIGYRYNARMQLDTLIDLAGGRTTLGYNEDGLESTRRLPTGLDVDRGYPSTHVTAMIDYWDATLREHLSRGYNHNARGLIGARRQRYAYAFETGEEVREYGYDPAGRVGGFVDKRYPDSSNDGSCSGFERMDPDGGACMPSGGNTILSESYTYDAVGNRTDRSAVVEGGNRLTQFNGYTLSYDADGNLTRKYKSGVIDQTLEWNSLGQLVRTVTNGVTVGYGYDALGRRIRRTPGNAAQSTWVWDGDDLLMELDASGTPLREYTYYPGVDEPHSLKQGSSVYYYATDFPGNVVGLIDSQNGLANQYRYRPFGQTEDQKESVSNPLRYMAREIDSETRLYYFRNRWYDPEIARFISEDPIGLAGGINPYAFAGNNPVNFIDPFGLDTCYLIERTTTSQGGRVIRTVYRLIQQWECEAELGGGGKGSSSKQNTCPAALNNPFVRAAAKQAWELTWRSRNSRTVREQGGWLVPNSSTTWTMHWVAPGTSSTLKLGNPPPGARYSLHTHPWAWPADQYGRGASQPLSNDDTAHIRKSGIPGIAVGRDTSSFASPGGSIVNCTPQ